MEENNTLSLDDLELDFDFENDTTNEDTSSAEDISELEVKEEVKEEDTDTETEVEEETTSEEVEAEEETRLIDDIIRRTGIEFGEDELQGIDDTEDGIAELAERIALKRAEQQLSDYLEQHPMTKQLLEFESMGGDPEQFKRVFFPEVDYSQFELSQEDTDLQKKIVRDSLSAKGFSEERIARNLEMYEDSGVLFDEANDALSELSQIQTYQKQQLLEQQQQEYSQMQQQAQEMWSQITEKVNNSESLGSIPLPKKDRAKFIDFIMPDPQTGISKRDQAAQNLTIDDQLAIDLILYHGLDSLSSILDNRVKTKEVRSIKDRIKKSKTQNRTSKLEKQSKNASIDDLEFRIT